MVDEFPCVSWLICARVFCIMAALYVLADEKQIGPIEVAVARHGVEVGVYSADQMAWMEGMDEWRTLGEILGGDVEVVDTGEIVEEGTGYVLMERALRVGEEIFPLSQLRLVEVEVEHTRRGKPRMWTIIFGVLFLMTLATPLVPQTANHWIAWAVSLIVFLLLFVRSLLATFKSTPAFLSVHLESGDDRILPMMRREARRAAEQINEAIAGARSGAPLADGEGSGSTALSADPTD